MSKRLFSVAAAIAIVILLDKGKNLAAGGTFKLVDLVNVAFVDINGLSASGAFELETFAAVAIVVATAVAVVIVAAAITIVIAATIAIIIAVEVFFNSTEVFVDLFDIIVEGSDFVLEVLSGESKIF